MTYELYEFLERKAHESEILGKEIDVGKICSTINNIKTKMTTQQSAEHYSEIYALILHYVSLQHSDHPNITHPYESKIMAGGKGLLFNIEALPAKIQKILAEYVEFYST